MAKKSCNIVLKVDDNGQITKTEVNGNIGTMFSVMAAAYAYLIDKYELDTEDVIARFGDSLHDVLDSKQTKD